MGALNFNQEKFTETWRLNVLECSLSFVIGRESASRLQKDVNNSPGKSLYIVFKQGEKTRLQLEKRIALTSVGPNGTGNSRHVSALTQISRCQLSCWCSFLPNWGCNPGITDLLRLKIQIFLDLYNFYN